MKEQHQVGPWRGSRSLQVSSEDGGEVGGRRLVQCRERLAGGAGLLSDRPSLLSSERKNCCRRSPAFASFVWRGLY